MTSDIEFHHLVEGFVYDLGVVVGQAESILAESGGRLTSSQRGAFKTLRSAAESLLESLGAME